MARGEDGGADGSGFASIAREIHSCAVASIAFVTSMDNPDDLTLVIAALRRGYEDGVEAEVIDVPACDGKGDDR
jgi:hypothetical protein